MYIVIYSYLVNPVIKPSRFYQKQVVFEPSRVGDVGGLLGWPKIPSRADWLQFHHVSPLWMAFLVFGISIQICWTFLGHQKRKIEVHQFIHRVFWCILAASTCLIFFQKLLGTLKPSRLVEGNFYRETMGFPGFSKKQLVVPPNCPLNQSTNPPIKGETLKLLSKLRVEASLPRLPQCDEDGRWQGPTVGGKSLKMGPCIPSTWESTSIRYTHDVHTYEPWDKKWWKHTWLPGTCSPKHPQPGHLRLMDVVFAYPLVICWSLLLKMAHL